MALEITPMGTVGTPFTVEHIKAVLNYPEPPYQAPVLPLHPYTIRKLLETGQIERTSGTNGYRWTGK